VAEDFARVFDRDTLAFDEPHTQRASRGFLACNYMNEAARELHFAADLLEARGLDMSIPEADSVAQAYVKDVIMHEVGHTLGFQHNFRSSGIYTLKQIQDPEFTRKNGITTSVMDYTPFKLAVKGEKQGEYSQSVLGPYDYWAVEYAYKEIAADREKVELARIAARSTEPQLAFANDYDAGSGRIRHRPGGEPLRPRVGPAGVLQAAPHALARAVGSAAGDDAGAGRATSATRAASRTASRSSRASRRWPPSTWAASRWFATVPAAAVRSTSRHPWRSSASSVFRFMVLC
jgi:hypothetical protein